MEIYIAAGKILRSTVLFCAHNPKEQRGREFSYAAGNLPTASFFQICRKKKTLCDAEMKIAAKLSSAPH